MRKLDSNAHSVFLPVSYTHLDVYKRQDQWGVGVWISGCDYLQAGDEGVIGVRGGEDVYKRQICFHVERDTN